MDTSLKTVNGVPFLLCMSVAHINVTHSKVGFSGTHKNQGVAHIRLAGDHLAKAPLQSAWVARAHNLQLNTLLLLTLTK